MDKLKPDSMSPKNSQNKMKTHRVFCGKRGSSTDAMIQSDISQFKLAKNCQDNRLFRQKMHIQRIYQS